MSCKRKEERKAYNKAYREANKEKIKAYNKAYREANKEKNKEKNKAYNKAYRKANKEKISAQTRVYHEANKEKIAAQNRAYHEANKEKIYAQKKAYREANWSKIAYSRHRESERIGRVPIAVTPITADQIQSLYDDLGSRCPVCLTDLVVGGSNFNSPSTDRLDNSVGYEYWNVWIICTSCNVTKSDSPHPSQLINLANKWEQAAAALKQRYGAVHATS